jgi:tetratricopeptide (TPR) repeat protein
MAKLHVTAATLALVLGGATILANGAVAASTQDWQNCTAVSIETVVRGCTLILGGKSETKAGRALALVKRARAYAKKGDYDRAPADLDEAIRLTPDSAEAYAWRGSIYRGKYDEKRATADIDKAIGLRPGDGKVYLPRAWQRRDRGEEQAANADFDKAIELLSKTILGRTVSAEADDYRGAAYVGKNDYDRAIADFDKPSSFSPATTMRFKIAVSPIIGKAIMIAPLPMPARRSASTLILSSPTIFAAGRISKRESMIRRRPTSTMRCVLAPKRPAPSTQRRKSP